MSDRLISTEALKKRINCYPGIRDAVAKQLRYVPTVDAEPVKYGRWISTGFMEVKSSICGAVQHELEDTNYCPNCGAKMQGEENTDG